MFRLSQLCGLRLHRPKGDIVINGPLSVARCAHCGKEIIRRGGGPWESVPPRMRIVWREPDAHEMTWPTQVLPRA